MIRWRTVLAVARAEARLSRRLVRFWLFAGLATLAALLLWAQYTFLHRAFSSYSATVATINPRYLIGAIGFWFLTGLILGVLFLAIDIRARDVRERIVEVLDSRPISNLELVFGRALGILTPLWLTAVAIAVLLTGLGLAFRAVIEPWSLLTLLTIVAIPALLVAIAATFGITLAVRNRALALVLAVAVLGGLGFLALRLPIWLSPAADFTGAFQLGFPSDILPLYGMGRVVLHRVGILVVAAGLLMIAAAIHPRRDDGARATRVGAGAAMLAVGAALVGWVVLEGRSEVARGEEFRAAHEARRDEPAPDVLAIVGTVDLTSPKRLAIDVELQYAAPADRALDRTLFSLNPGLRVRRVQDGGGADVPFRHEQGLLEVDEAVAAGATGTLRIAADGVLDDAFAYLDAAVRPLEVDSLNGQLFLLGYEPSIQDRRYVALMPGSRWLPAGGSEARRGDPSVRPVDFARLDLTVQLPDGWTAVLPGRREPAGAGRERFAPRNPAPPPALLASRFERRATDLGGVEGEVLLIPTHAAQLDVFGDAADKLRERLADLLTEARDLGLDYPYETLSLVEIPAPLRGFGSGWRMDSTLAPPGAILTRENGFPTAMFAKRFEDPDDFKDKDGGIVQAKLEALEKHFENDFTGGNPFVGASRGLFLHQTAGRGADALPLDFVFDQLATRVVTERYGFFSPYLFRSDMNDLIGKTIQNYLASRQQIDFVDAVVGAVSGRSEVWDAVLDRSLGELDPYDKPERALDVLTLKGGAMAQSMVDGLGRESSGKFLGSLVERARGRTYDRADVVEAGGAVGVDLAEWLDLWVDGTALPGFVTPRSEAFRIPDAEDGAARYQTLVTVANLEPVPGLVRLEVLGGPPGDEEERVSQGPFRVEPGGAVEIGAVSSKPPRAARILPYLSLNRGSFAVEFGGVDAEEIRAIEPHRGVRPSDWAATPDPAIVVDDLDPGFSTAGGTGGGGFRLRGRGSKSADTDGGLALYAPFVGPGVAWQRTVRDDAYGKYRHTAAIANPGTKGGGTARFEAQLPRGGSWTLEIHLLALSSDQPMDRRIQPKRWAIEIEHDSGTERETFDAGDGDPGWNTVGKFEVSSGTVRVTIGAAEDGSTVVADAIRWVPERVPEPPAAEVAQSSGAAR